MSYGRERATTQIGSVSPLSNPAGWNNTDVTVSFTCSDSLSGLAPGSPPVATVVSAEGANQQVINTDEGPIFLELLADDTVFIAHSFSEDTANSLRQVVLRRPAGGAKTSSADLSVRLLEIPSIQAFQEKVGREILGSPARLQLDKAR